eukprot:GILJ01000487.1.p1 GENE.GILJ01000487.1~~GILJ01000487.1.p1  ORF type:complete len:184 (-),score=15.73 GILJ01000487.1:595-1146(-)
MMTQRAKTKRKREEEGRPDCNICFDPIFEQGVLSCCKHEFCLLCIQKWAAVENTCPICKRRFSKMAPKPVACDASKRQRKLNSVEEIMVPHRDQKGACHVGQWVASASTAGTDAAELVRILRSLIWLTSPSPSPSSSPSITFAQFVFGRRSAAMAASRRLYTSNQASGSEVLGSHELVFPHHQ